MIAFRIAAMTGAIVGLTACASAPSGPRPAKLTSMPDASQMTAIKSAVKDAMKRDDLGMDPGRLIDTPRLIVRPKVVEGLTDRVPGTPTNMILMTDGSVCWLQDDRGPMRVDLPEGLTCA